VRPVLCALAALVPLAAFAADPPPKPDKKAEKAETKVEVPYRLTDTKHVLVRAKLNGKGPFNFILDTGAPAVFVTKAIAKKISLEEDKKGWGHFDSFVLEGGLKVEKAQGRIEDLFQLEGMNGMGLAGVELHGVIGYNVLAKFRITYDFTADKLAFVPLDFDPPEVMPLGKGGGGQGGLDSMGGMMKMLAGMMGVKPNFEVRPGGFVGIEVEEKEKKLLVKTVLKGSPADDAGVKAGDRLDSVKDTSLDSLADVARAFGKANVGDTVKLTVERGGEKKTLGIKLGGGL
jgi:serine protease DegQ